MNNKKKWAPYVLVSLSLILLLTFFIIPFIQLIFYSFWRNVPGSNMPEMVFSLENYYHLLFTEGPYYLAIYGRTLKLAIVATIITFVISYPLSWFIARKQGMVKSLLIILMMLPMIGGAMIQTLGWIILLSPLGVINGLLLNWHVIDVPIQFLGKELGITIGLIQSYIPMMVLPLLTAMGTLNPSLEDAAKSLGASFFTTFFKIIVPLTLPGALAGGVLVFLSNLTSFVTPLLLGQGKVPVFGTVAYTQGIEVMNYPFASAFSLFPMFILAVGMILFKLCAAKKTQFMTVNGE
jgi:putative spermidine/putrescine transport system permease protein